MRFDFYSPDWGKFLSPDNDGGGGAPADDSDIDNNTSLDDAQKTAMKKERTARRDAERKARETATTLADVQKQLTTLNEEKTARDAAAATQAEKDREAKGQFEQLATDRATERDNAIRERDAAKKDLTDMTTERDALRLAVLDINKERFDKLPEEVREAYTGSDDDALAKLAFIPKGEKIAAKFGTTTDEATNANVNGNPANPPVSAVATQAADKAAQELNAQRYG